jgi:RNA polymerase sigma-70 factor (ECF subfamily)
LQLSDTARALKTLPAWQREALILVGAGGYSYESAAKICNCPVGTMKSRVVRARKALIALLDSRIPLPDEARPAAINAANEIAAQLDSLAPLNTTSKPPSGNSV